MPLPLPNPNLEAPSGVSTLLTQRLREIQQNLDEISLQFPIQAGKLGGEIPDSKLASPQIRGQVKANGEKALGSGFSSEKTAKGTYKVTLAAELPSEGIMVVQPLFAGAGLGFANVRESGAKTFKVELFNFIAAFELADTAFNFIVVKG